MSISITVRKAFSDMPDIGAKKFPAAPVTCQMVRTGMLSLDYDTPQITKSILPNFSIVFETASRSDFGSRTSA